MENKGTLTIETNRLILRQYTLADADAMYRNWASDPEVSKYLTWPVHKNVNVSQTVLTSWIEKYTDPAFYNWAIELKEEKEVIGNISVVQLRSEIEAAEIGYCMGRKWWGQEIMPEALCAVTDFLFREVGVNRVAACHDVNNPKSGRVMEKAGMKKEGILRAAGRNNQGIHDLVWWAILKSDKEIIYND